jgi:pimeloyl-ACP methyl ester carboxylesterase
MGEAPVVHEVYGDGLLVLVEIELPETVRPKQQFVTKVYAVAAVISTLMGTTLNAAAADPAPQTGIKNVVLVHGAFADGSGWEAVAKILEKVGYTVSVAQPPETSYADDQKYTKAPIDAMDRQVVLVGHSYGGSIITEAGNHPKVSALVYIAAFALDEGESCASIEQALPQASKAFKPDSICNWWIAQEHFAADFAADIPPSVSHFMAQSQVPISTDSFTHKVTSPAWKARRFRNNGRTIRAQSRNEFLSALSAHKSHLVHFRPTADWVTRKGWATCRIDRGEDCVMGCPALPRLSMRTLERRGSYSARAWGC